MKAIATPLSATVLARLVRELPSVRAVAKGLPLVPSPAQLDALRFAIVVAVLEREIAGQEVTGRVALVLPSRRDVLVAIRRPARAVRPNARLRRARG